MWGEKWKMSEFKGCNAKWILQFPPRWNKRSKTHCPWPVRLHPILLSEILLLQIPRPIHLPPHSPSFGISQANLSLSDLNLASIGTPIHFCFEEPNWIFLNHNYCNHNIKFPLNYLFMPSSFAFLRLAFSSFILYQVSETERFSFWLLLDN